jgi:Domain of unknown function (DUF4145)
MKCPHCNTGIHQGFAVSTVVSAPAPLSLDKQPLAPALTWSLYHQRCPECHRSVILLHLDTSGMWSGWKDLHFMAYPRSHSRPIAKEIPDPYRQDFSEACTVLADSPKASAALSRRCLQAILKDKLGATKKNLYEQIEEVIATGKLPPHIENGLHDVRNIGNFAAHPMKSTTTGAIVDVEPGEAEWNLEVVEMLFDFCFVQPALFAERKAALDKKLKDIGKGKKP